MTSTQIAINQKASEIFKIASQPEFVHATVLHEGVSRILTLSSQIANLATEDTREENT